MSYHVAEFSNRAGVSTLLINLLALSLANVRVDLLNPVLTISVMFVAR